jgi:hypothetical protein
LKEEKLEVIGGDELVELDCCCALGLAAGAGAHRVPLVVLKHTDFTHHELSLPSFSSTKPFGFCRW